MLSVTLQVGCWCLLVFSNFSFVTCQRLRLSGTCMTVSCEKGGYEQFQKYFNLAIKGFEKF